MIWILGIALSLVVSLYLATPFLAQNGRPQASDEIQAYKDELRALERNEDADAAKTAMLQARLLKAAKAESPGTGTRSRIIPAFICLCLLGGGAGIYTTIGSPNFTPETRQAPPTGNNMPAPSYESLLIRFESRLAENPDDFKAWTLYGRTLMISGDTAAGLRAYEKAMELSDIPEIRKEYEAAKKFAAKREFSPSADDVAAVQSLSADDRTAAIEGMVEGLRARLETDPTDTAGWSRLLRSRKVLGQADAAAADMEALRKALPNQAEDIIMRAGWAD